MTLCPFCMRETAEEVCPHCGKLVSYVGDPTHLQAGYVLTGTHPYIFGAPLGQGGFGITYIALDMDTNQRVAIKEYFPTFCARRGENMTVLSYLGQDAVYNKGRDRFLDEARVLKSLSDLKSIVNVLDFFELNNSAYLVMEFLEGDSLKSHAQKHGKFPAQAFLQQLKPLMEDIEQMHQRGVVHRDIAPDNIILTPDGQMKLIDFGAARSYVGDKSMTVVVKKGFAPIEQYMRHGSTAATDVYAIAATIYYCITGVVLPDSAERQYDGKTLRSPTSLGADLTSKQEQALEKALLLHPADRTQSVFELLKVLIEQPKTSETQNIRHSEPELAIIQSNMDKKPSHAAMVMIWCLIIVFALLFVLNEDEVYIEPKPNASIQEIIEDTLKKKPHTHVWEAATCISPKTCKTCGYSEGSPGNHQWIPATYTSPKKCSVCGTTSGKALNPLSKYGVGEMLAFGVYEQDGNSGNGIEAITWRVLVKEADRMLVMSEYGIESRRYHNKNESVNWSSCSLRSWLNGSFYETAFSSKEHSQIMSVAIDGSSAKDKLFLLSYDECEQYLSGNSNRMCYATRYALNQGAYASPDTGSSWWLLRTQGKNGRYVMSINTDGSIDYDGGRVSSDYGIVRPVMWLDISN